MTQKQKPRRSLNDRIEAAVAADFTVAGITNEPETQSTDPVVITQQQEGGCKQQLSKPVIPDFPTKKATTIMPKEVFAALQRYCTDTDTPKHRAIYHFIIDGLHATGTITDSDYQRFRNMAALLTTTYEKK